MAADIKIGKDQYRFFSERLHKIESHYNTNFSET